MEFEELDANGDGMIMPDEVESKPGLMEHWQVVDMSGDRRVDRSEFAQFDVIEQPSPPDGSVGALQ